MRRTRAERRAHRQRALAKARRITIAQGLGRTVDARQLGRLATTPCPCSTCCGNRRPWEGETMQERRAALREKEDHRERD